QRISAAGEEASTVTQQNPQPLFSGKRIFSELSDLSRVFNMLAQFTSDWTLGRRNFLRQNGNRTYKILSYPQRCPQVRRKTGRI
ncbi:MAG: hypothetical protein ACSHW1_09665, partial [Yoonia sp.]|uniref:hypothetical protein n=1 Tax=Yoonia sp. TaxID=2212373 RepID=UPI003EF82DCD